MEPRHELDLSHVADLQDGRASAAMLREVSDAVGQGIRYMQQHHKTREVRRGGGAPVAGRWTYRTGEASRSFRIGWRKGDMQGSYYTSLKRLRMLEEGGTIRPKKGKYLAIPTDAAKHGVGPAASPREYSGIFFMMSKRGNPMLVRAKGKSGIEVMFHLRKEVKLSPRPTLERTVKSTATVVTERMADAVQRGLSDGQ